MDKLKEAISPCVEKVEDKKFYVRVKEKYSLVKVK
jgi:hypothetical protein